MKFDTPHTFAIDRGHRASRYSPDFREGSRTVGSIVEDFRTWLCPASKVLMLEPNFRNRSFGNDFRNLGSFRQDESDAIFWRSISKSSDGLQMFTSVRPAGQTKFISPLALAHKLVIFQAADAVQDNLYWAHESLQPIPIDGSFAIHYQGLTDELLRKNNWMYLQWDNIGIHISHQGRVNVFWYPDRGRPEDDPTFMEEFDIAEPGELLGKAGHFTFIPIPGRGLAMYHSQGAFKQYDYAANATHFSARGAHLIRWDARFIGSHFRLFESSLIRIALNPFHSNVFGFQDVTFAEEANFLEKIFDPGYRPINAPSDVSAGVLASFSANFATVTASLQNSDATAAWTAGTHRQARVLFNMQTSDDRYSPFIYGWGVEWLPVRESRNTEEVVVTDGWADVVQYLELTDDSEGHFEGVAKLKVQSEALVRIAERGIATFQVEYSPDNSEWTLYNGGIAKFERPLTMEYHPAWGLFWRAEVTLCDLYDRLQKPNKTGTAFNGFTIAESINLVLTVNGFDRIEEEDFPFAIFYRSLPPLPEGESNFPLSPKGGDRAEKVLRVLLMLASQQYLEFQLKYGWALQKWTVTERERDLEDVWALVFDSTLEDHSSQIAYYEDCKLFPIPPEGNQLVVIGQTGSDPTTAKLIQSDPIYNDVSRNDVSNPDYLGYADSIEVTVQGLTDQEWANIAARQIAPRVLHWTSKAIVSLPPGHFNLDIAPNRRINLNLPPVQVNHGEDSRHALMWVKQRTIIIDAEEHGAAAGVANERSVLHLDTAWENEWKGLK